MRIKLCIILMALLASPLFAQRLSRDAKELEARPVAIANYWQGEEDWNLAASWSLGSVPGTGEAAIFDGRSQNSPQVNVDLGAGGPDELMFMPAYLAGIGSPGNPLSNLDGTDKVTIRGTGNYYIEPQTAGQTIIDNAGCFVIISGGTVHSLDVKEGGVTVIEGSTFRAGSRVATYGPYAQITIEPSDAATYPRHFLVEAGLIVNKDETDGAGAARIVVGGGEFQQIGLFKTGSFAYNFGGTLYLAPSSDPSAQAPVIYNMAGFLDSRDSEFPIPVNRLVIGPASVVLGSAVFSGLPANTLDLREDNP